jgi:hypothetical protein
MRNTVAAVVTAHAARIQNGMLSRALDSVTAQTSPQLDHISVALDHERQGAAVTRDRALAAVPIMCDWVAFLDSDDAWMPEHVEKLLACAIRNEADYVYSWFTIKDARGREHPEWDPFPKVFGCPWDPREPVQTTVTTLVRRELAQSVMFSDGWGPIETLPPTPTGHTAGEDWRFTLGCMAAGAKIVHFPQRTWYWYHHGANSSGCPGRGDA